MDAALFLFTKVASTEGFLIATLAIIMAFLFVRDRRKAIALFGSAAGLILTLNVLKESFAIPRPANALIEVTGYAFPSGHAAGAAFLALVVMFLARKLSRPLRYLIVVIATLAALAIGASRISYQVHTPVQVLAGFAVGVIFAFVFIRFASK